MVTLSATRENPESSPVDEADQNPNGALGNDEQRHQQCHGLDHSTNGDTSSFPNAAGQPYELLIMDTPDISTATRSGAGTREAWGTVQTAITAHTEIAITQDGSIVANFLTTGTMQANVSRAVP
ncbi:MAG: hypothetical protein ACLSA6_00235 [Holdemania massiliensis]